MPQVEGRVKLAAKRLKVAIRSVYCRMGKPE